MPLPLMEDKAQTRGIPTICQTSLPVLWIDEGTASIMGLILPCIASRITVMEGFVSRGFHMLIDDDLRGRVQRLLAGSHQVHDLHRLFLALRDRAHNRESVREIGDFVAHRAERQKGLVTQTGRDVFTSIDVWSLSFRGQKTSLEDIARAAWANFRLASDSHAGSRLRLPAWHNQRKTQERPS